MNKANKALHPVVAALKKSEWMKFKWTHFWGQQKYGVLFDDLAFEPAPEIKEAIRRLDPAEYDARQMRLQRAMLVNSRNEILPKDQWTKWEEETFYLHPIVDQIEREKMERSASTGIKPYYITKRNQEKSGAMPVTKPGARLS